MIFMTALIMESCTNPRTASSPADSHLARSTDTLMINKSLVLFKGLYTFGNEVNTFRDCGGNKVYWVNDSLANMEQAYKSASKFLSYPYESVYAEFKGYLAGRSELGYASEYENVLVVTEIIKLEAKNFRTECYNYEFIALGNEPFWSLDIIPSEKRIMFKNAGLEKVHEFIYSAPVREAGFYRYEPISPGQDKLSILIREEQCSDGMSDRKYNHSAEINLNGVLFKGCAIKKADQLIENP